MIFNQLFSRKNSLFVILFCLVIASPSELQGQIKGKIIEKESKLAIAFASVTYKKQLLQKGVISDIYGKFEIEESDINSITVTCVGYKPNKILIPAGNDFLNITVELETYTHELNEVIVTPTNNPAIQIIKNVLANKDKNNFQSYEKFTYKCYVKILIDLKISGDANAQDSSKLNNNERIKKRAAFISEYVISCLKIDNYIENKIIAQKTSGFDDPLFVQFLVSVFHNSISFYNNSISLFELPISNDKSIAEYISPLSEGCLSIYNYQLKDTIMNPNDTVYMINYYPKKGKNFNSLKGELYISTNGFAIKNIVAGPTEKGLIGFKFKQDYEFINSRWFPARLDEEIGLVSQKVRGNINAYPAYLITSKIDSVNYDPSITKNNRNHEKVFLDESSIKNSDYIISAIRPDSLTVREKNTVHFMDDLGKKTKFNYLLKVLPKLANGKIPVSIFDIDLYRLYSFNKYEGSRPGFGLYTNDKLSRYFSVGGFTGYGFKDKKYKYGGQVVFDLFKANEIQLKLSYQNNLKEAGFDLIDDYSKLSFSDYLRSYFGYRFDNCIERKAEFSFRALRFLKVTTSLSLKEIEPTYSYSYKGSIMTNYQADEIQVNAKYAYGSDLATYGNQHIVNYEGNPIINITFKRGLNLFSSHSFQYNRIETTIDFTAYNGRIGQSNFRLASGFIDQSLPYGLLFTGEGSNNTNIPLLINNSFQALLPYEFLSDKYVNLFYSHNFGSLLFSTKEFKPQFVIVHNSGWGALDNASYQGIDFKGKDKIYLESGLIINNVIKLKYVNMFYFGFGIAGFYRYGYYSYDNFKDNLALKLSVSISLK
jgi:hypothetical protein